MCRSCCKNSSKIKNTNTTINREIRTSKILNSDKSNLKHLLNFLERFNISLDTILYANPLISFSKMLLLSFSNSIDINNILLSSI